MLNLVPLWSPSRAKAYVVEPVSPRSVVAPVLANDAFVVRAANVDAKPSSRVSIGSNETSGAVLSTLPNMEYAFAFPSAAVAVTVIM
jgi:hypothetical protein